MPNRIDQAIDMGLGAGLMYFLDPKHGRRRRKRLSRQIDRQLRMTGDAVTAVTQRAQLRATDLLPSARLALYRSLAADEELMKRARQVMGPGRSLVPSAGSSGFPMPAALALLAAVAVGAGLMYILDPRMGRRQRSLMSDRAMHAKHEAGEALTQTTIQMSNQASGAAAEVRQRSSNEAVSDQVLAERVRSYLSGGTSHPGSIEVTAHEGRVTLRGPILADEVDALLARIRAVPGVKSIENRLEVHKEPGRVSGLQG